MKTLLKIVLIIISLSILIQFIRIDKSVPEYDKNADFIISEAIGAKEAELLKNACYDCHSYETKYPWYADIAPVSWLLKNHINEGREHFNFNTWPNVKLEYRSHRLTECAEEIEKGRMPMRIYINAHPEAELSEEDKKLLIELFNFTAEKYSK